MQPKGVIGLLVGGVVYGGVTSPTLGQTPNNPEQKVQDQYVQESQVQPTESAQDAFRQGDFNWASELFAQQLLYDIGQAKSDDNTNQEPTTALAKSNLGSIVGNRNANTYAAINYSILQSALQGDLEIVDSLDPHKALLRLYLGSEINEDNGSFSGDALIPLKEGNNNNSPFLYLRGASNTQGGGGGGIGGGYRHALDDGRIVGINSLVGVKDTGKSTSPWTMAQLEILGLGGARNIDVRGTYTHAWDGEKLVAIINTPNTQIRKYEKLLSGFHGEVGIWVPVADKADLGIFGGYGSYDEGIDGHTARLELDLGNLIITAGYSDIQESMVTFGLVIPFGPGGRAHRTSQFNSDLFREMLKLGPQPFASRQIQKAMGEERPPDKPKFPTD